MNNIQTYRRYADCIPVRGFLRSIIMDLTREKFMYIPNDLSNILLKKLISKKNLSKEYFDFLMTNEFIFPCEKNELRLYPDLNTEWNYPAILTNALIEIEKENFLDIVIPQLIELGCYHLMIVCQNQMSIKLLRSISLLTVNTPIEIYGKYNTNFNQTEAEKILKDNPRISYILLYDAPTTKIISKNSIRGNIILYVKHISWTTNNISLKNFKSNITLYTESLQYNNFFNRKICITKNGLIKNYPTTNKSFGSIFIDSIKEIVTTNKYQTCWKIHKDIISICKDCEYRYMCIDHRIPIKTKNGLYCFKKSARCPYNPYICKWKGEVGYVPVEECGTYSRDTGFVPDKKKIRKLNREIWGEEE